MKDDEDSSMLRIDLLREQHQLIDDEIDAANKWQWISPRESLRLKKMKVRRLYLKDQITRLERDRDA